METKKERKTTQLKKEAFLKALSKCTTVAAACDASGISRSSVYRWIKEDRDFEAAFNNVEVEIAYGVEAVLIESAFKGNLTAVIFYLKNKGWRIGYGSSNDKKDADNGDQINFGDGGDFLKALGKIVSAQISDSQDEYLSEPKAAKSV